MNREDLIMNMSAAKRNFIEVYGKFYYKTKDLENEFMNNYHFTEFNLNFMSPLFVLKNEIIPGELVSELSTPLQDWSYAISMKLCLDSMGSIYNGMRGIDTKIDGKKFNEHISECLGIYDEEISFEKPFISEDIVTNIKPKDIRNLLIHPEDLRKFTNHKNIVITSIEPSEMSFGESLLITIDDGFKFYAIQIVPVIMKYIEFLNKLSSKINQLL